MKTSNISEINSRLQCRYFAHLMSVFQFKFRLKAANCDFQFSKWFPTVTLFYLKWEFNALSQFRIVFQIMIQFSPFKQDLKIFRQVVWNLISENWSVDLDVMNEREWEKSNTIIKYATGSIFYVDVSLMRVTLCFPPTLYLWKSKI